MVTSTQRSTIVSENLTKPTGEKVDAEPKIPHEPGPKGPPGKGEPRIFTEAGPHGPGKPPPQGPSEPPPESK